MLRHEEESISMGLPELCASPSQENCFTISLILLVVMGESRYAGGASLKLEMLLFFFRMKINELMTKGALFLSVVL